MQQLRAKARQLLESGSVAVVIGYGRGSRLDRRRPLFARVPAETDDLVLDELCRQNLAGYLTRHEVRRLGRPAVVAATATLRSILQLAAERQLADDAVVALVPDGDTVRELAAVGAIEEYLATATGALRPDDQERLARLAALSSAERRAYWAEELERCLKCYACRASCPMCYCERCTMDCNRPQWVPVASHALGNLEYHLVRAMHLAGRCVECGSCGAACPVGIPVHLFTIFAEESVRRQFGRPAGAGAGVRADYALATFRPDDKESFIR